jgi:hypothetical protein
VLGLRKSAEGEEVEVGSGWRGPIARRIASELFPESADMSQALFQLYEAVHGEDSREPLIAQLGALSQKFIKTDARFADMARVCAHLSVEEEIEQ